MVVFLGNSVFIIQPDFLFIFEALKIHAVSNSQGKNLGRLVTPARTSGLSSTQGMVRERAVKVSCSQSY